MGTAELGTGGELRMLEAGKVGFQWNWPLRTWNWNTALGTRNFGVQVELAPENWVLEYTALGTGNFELVTQE